MSADNQIIRYHLTRGGTAYVASGGWIEERVSDQVTRIAALDTVPSTFDGSATFQVANALAATAAARAAGASLECVTAALQSFELCVHNNGRLNVFAIGDAHVMVDYGHNPSAIRTICDTVAKWQRRRITVVLGVPGDRRDDLIRASARAAAGVDRIIIREDDDTRGRARGAVARILHTTLQTERPGMQVDVILNEGEAVDHAIAQLGVGDVAVVFAEDIGGVIERLRGQGAVPAAEFLRLVTAQPAA